MVIISCSACNEVLFLHAAHIHSIGYSLYLVLQIKLKNRQKRCIDVTK